MSFAQAKSTTASVLWLAVFFTLLVALLLSFAEFAFGQLLNEKLIDRVVAIVNGDPILHSEISKKVSSGFAISVSAFPAGEDAPLFDKKPVLTQKGCCGFSFCCRCIC